MDSKVPFNFNIPLHYSMWEKSTVWDNEIDDTKHPGKCNMVANQFSTKPLY